MSEVKVYERDEVLTSHSLEPLNPHPVFPQWSIYDVYPYQFMGNVQCKAVRKTFKMIYLENEFLQVCIAPDIGGRVWFIYDKISKRHAINYSSKVITYNAGFGLNYTCSGLEVNYPLAHSCTTSRKREYKILRNSDGSASVIIGEYEQIWRTRWFVKYTLIPGRSFLKNTVRIYNRSLHDSMYMYWANCGFVMNDETQFIFPENIGAMHGKETIKLSWPIWKGKDISYWKNVVEPLGLYMLDAREPYFGYYDHGTDYGFVHHGDLSDLPGKKYWSWGSGFTGRVANAKTHHGDYKVYGEMQAGRIVIQEHLDRMPPETEAEWSEYWYPVRNTCGFNGVGKDTALNLEIIKIHSDRTEVLIKTIGSGTFQGIKVILTCSQNKPVEGKISINPVTPTQRRFVLPYKVGNKDTLSARLVNENGEVLGVANLRDPSKRDSWGEVCSKSQGPKPMSAEEMFMEGERLAKDWGNHDECQMYEEALKVDPGLSSAHLELGKIKLFRGDYENAIHHLKKVIEKNPDNLDSYYSLGVALILTGKAEESTHCLEKSSRYDFENRSRTRLAEIKIRSNDIHDALKYLNRVTESAPRLTRSMTLKAICLRRIGKIEEAYETVKKARKIDIMDPFPQVEEMFIEKELNRKNIGKSVKNLLVQFRKYEPPYLEVVFDYGNIGLIADALTLLKSFPKKGPIAMFYQAYLEYKMGKVEYKKSLETACTLSPINHCAWQLEMIPVLEWAIEILPRNPRPYFHLGNLWTARRQLEKGVDMWKKAEKMGEDSYLPYSNLGYYETKVAKNDMEALRYFKKANQLEPNDPYVKIEIFNLLRILEKKGKATKFLERDMNSIKTYPKLAHLLLSQYVSDKKYARFDALVPSLNFKINWPVPGPHQLWGERYVNEGLDTMATGQYEKAIALFEKSMYIPPNLGIITIETDKQERVFYHIGRCYEKMGKINKAQKMWEKAIAIDRQYAWEIAYAYSIWIQRYYQALCFKKLGRISEANMIFDGLELIAKNEEIPEEGRKYLMDLVMRGKFGKEEEHDPYFKKMVEVATKAEL